MRDVSDSVVLLKAAGETTRLRMLFLLAQGELSVKDFTEILGQSQPRVSRHLKLLADAQLVERYAEGAWAYYRLNRSGAGGAFIDWLLTSLSAGDAELDRDRARLQDLRASQQERAGAYFSTIAESWDKVRSLHVPESAVEEAVLAAAGAGPLDHVLDLGTGTGRMLELLAGRYRRATGLDSSREMLAVARAKLDAAGIENAQVRLGDIGDLGEYHDGADLVVLHQVLHYFDDPGFALAHAAACLRQGGRMLIVDFAPHDHEFLRDEQAHRRLGLSHEQVRLWAEASGLDLADRTHFPPDAADGLTVCLWVLSRNR